jgi:hypothetical protein
MILLGFLSKKAGGLFFLISDENKKVVCINEMK